MTPYADIGIPTTTMADSTAYMLSYPIVLHVAGDRLLTLAEVAEPNVRA